MVWQSEVTYGGEFDVPEVENAVERRVVARTECVNVVAQSEGVEPRRHVIELDYMQRST